ncbi:unnamed protein product [Cylindrotheca closterium]|uniref:Uncharacterized protein n=1 Tax=Cylindrotheca closterium TaxID=2856 RepID=A0AAD2FUQ6_9STRA|nr:unnamed protein product [Cylindrotheca closterium]
MGSINMDAVLDSSIWQISHQEVKEKATSKDTMHVAVGIHLDGTKDQTGFMDEWEVQLKSLVIHSPIDYHLHIHIIVNQAALQSIRERIQKHSLTEIRSRNYIRMTCYPVDDYEAEWNELIYNSTNKTPFNTAKKIYTIGAYYRLIADRVLPLDLVNVIYMDTDVVLNSNLNALYPYLDSEKHMEWIQIGSTYCSGFMIMNLKEFPRHFWRKMDELARQKTNFAGVHDQYLLRLVRESLPPESTGILPKEWNVHYSDHHRDQSRIVDQEIAYWHFNGIRNQRRGFWHRDYDFMCRMDVSVECPRDSSNETTLERFRQSWPIADFYVRIPWLWVRYMAMSLIPTGEEGYLLAFAVVGT